jgi:carbonic anhydrase
MDFLALLAQRNQQFAASKFASGLKMLPSKKTVIIGCVDPRVDPAELFGIEDGEAAVIRNVGGRVTRNTLESMALVGKLATAAGQPVGPGWNLIVLHHTDCGITGCSHLAPDMLAQHLGVQTTDFDAMGITDAYQSVAVDVAKLHANPNVARGMTVTGMVYDVATGLVETVVPPAPLGSPVATPN